MRFTLTFDMDNAAFENEDEVSLILLKVRNDYEIGSTLGVSERAIMDSNGNRVGQWKVEA